MAHPAGRIKNRRGAILLMTVFIIALGAALIIGFLQVSTTDLQIVRNTQYSTRALYIADAGIEDALYELDQSSLWNAGFSNKSFAGDSYTVTIVNNHPSPSIIDSISTVAGSFQRHIQVQTTIQGSNPPSIDYWKEI